LKTSEPEPAQDRFRSMPPKTTMALWGAIYHGIRRWTLNRDGQKEDRVSASRTRITVETHTLTIIRQPKPVRLWCRECAREVEVIGVDEAQALTGTTHILRDSAGNQKWHLGEAGNGALLVCVESLRKSL
jgi:hypothetical protein